MSTTSPAEFLIAKARAAEARDPYEAKAWIIAAKSLFPNNFGIQFFNYLQEKNTEVLHSELSIHHNLVYMIAFCRDMRRKPPNVSVTL